jgi:predicted Zn finger-like uncharacterized protein
MILTCPSCAQRYRLPPDSIGPAGRKVRCRACGHQWHAAPGEPTPTVEATEAAQPPAPPPPAPVPPSPAALPPEPPRAGEAPPPPPQPTVEPAPLPPVVAGPARRRERGGGTVAWLSLLLLALVAVALYLGRHQVVEALPAVAPYLQMVGIPVTVQSGLELRNLTSSRSFEGGRPLLLVEGEIHNLAGQERQVPRVRVALLDDSRTEVEFGLFDAEAATLAPGASTRFVARLVDPPAAAKTYAVSLADGR